MFKRWIKLLVVTFCVAAIWSIFLYYDSAARTEEWHEQGDRCTEYLIEEISPLMSQEICMKKALKDAINAETKLSAGAELRIFMDELPQRKAEAESWYRTNCGGHDNPASQLNYVGALHTEARNLFAFSVAGLFGISGMALLSFVLHWVFFGRL